MDADANAKVDADANANGCVVKRTVIRGRMTGITGLSGDRFRGQLKTSDRRWVLAGERLLTIWDR